MMERGQMRSWKFNGVLSRWLWSFGIVLLIPLLLMSVAYQQSQWVIEDEIYKANSALLTQLQQEIDNYIDFTYRLTDIISLHSKVNAIVRNQVELAETDRLFMVETLADFKAYNISKRYVEHFYIYFHVGDFILTDSAYYETPLYYDLNVDAEQISLEKWKQKMADIYRSEFINMQKFNGKTGIMYAQTLSVHHSSPSHATLILELNEDGLKQSIRTIQAYNEGDVLILDDNNQLLLSSEWRLGEKDFSNVLNQDFEEAQGAFEAEMDGEKITISYTTSARTNWKYVYVLPTRLYSEKVQYIRNVSIGFLIVALVLGSIIALFLAKRNYDPLKRLVRNMAERGGPETKESAKINEYVYLEKMIDRAFEHNSDMMISLEKQKKTLFSNLLVRLLKGRIELSFPLKEVLPEYGVYLGSNKFAVMLFYLEDYSKFFHDDESDEEKNRKFVQLIMTNIIEELVGRKHQGWMTEVDDMMACIINFKSDVKTEEALEYMRKVAEESKQFLEKRFHITFTVSVSSVHKSAREVASAYLEALEAMEYRMVVGPCQTIVWREVQNQKSMPYAYSLQEEKQLISHVSAGDFTLAKQTLDDIINSNLYEGNLSINMIRCLMFDMCSTMMRAAMEANIEDDTLHKDNMETIKELISGSTVSTMTERMTQFLEKVCRHVDERNKSSKVHLKENVMAYIAQNYSDPNMSVGSISDYFDVHPSYLSRYFREQTGSTLTDYISSYRIERSKELLLKDELLIKDIGVMVGIYSSSTFIRVFRKFEGVTPSTYRGRNRQ